METAGVANAFEQFQKSFHDELSKREQKNHDLQAELDECRQQKALLQAQLDKLLAASKPEGNSDDDISTTNRSSSATVPYSTYRTLQEEYEVNYKNLKVIHAALDLYKTKYYSLKGHVKAWQDYARKCEERLKSRKTPHETSRKPSPLRAPSPDPSILTSSRPSSAGRDALSRVESRRHARSSSNVSLSDVPNLVVPENPASRLRAVMYAPGVNDDLPTSATEAVKGKGPETSRAAPLSVYQPILEPRSDATEDLDDSALSANDRAHSAPAAAMSEIQTTMPPALLQRLSTIYSAMHDGDLGSPIRIKSEAGSSPPLQPSSTDLKRTDTLDLDDTGHHISTPRKIKRMQSLLMRQASSIGLSAAELEWYKQYQLGSQNRPLVINDRSSEPPMDTPEASETDVAFTGTGTVQPDVLRTIDANRRDLPIASVNRLRKRKYGLAADISAVAEDGDTIRSRLKPDSPNRKKLRANNMVSALLDDTTPVKRTLIQPAVPSASKQPRSRQDEVVETPSAKRAPPTVSANHQQLPTPQTVRPVRQFADKAVPEFRKPPTPAQYPAPRRSPRKRNTPLRQRPVEELKPDDFKPNSRAFGDIDLDVVEPIRSRADRRHLQACTDPNCMQCGAQLRTLAEMLPVTLGSTLFASTQDDNLTEDERLVKFYLGETWDHAKFLRMQHDERHELVIQAKMQVLAERHGRHRLRPNARAKSPPGFWDVEMPTTQDMDLRAEEMERRQREVAQERYREAMRPGGRWLFKDE